MKKNTDVLPKPFIAPGSEKKPTSAEIRKRQDKSKKLKKIGVSTTLLTSSDDTACENPYRIQAMILINQDKEVPAELVKQIEDFDKNVLHLNYK